MLNFARSKLDALLGRGEHAITIPVMDGPFQPNNLLEGGETCVEDFELDNLCQAGGSIFYSTGATVKSLPRDKMDGEPSIILTGEVGISALAARENVLAIGFDGQGVHIKGGAHDGKIITEAAGRSLNCVTAILFLSEDEIVVANGSASNTAERWKFDLVERGKSGTIWRIDLRTNQSRLLADNIAYPYGLALAPGSKLYFSECWRYRVCAVGLDGNGKPEVVAANLPGYPARITATGNSGYLVSFLSTRNQLYEFVLRERQYCKQMMATIDPEYWLAPMLRSNLSFMEQIQGDSVKMMGILKPWAPPRSYGLVVLCDQEMHPQVSWHSRADGVNHGTAAVVDLGDAFLVASKGSGRAVKVSYEHPELAKV